ncbi:DUF3833 domain-containing protein [Tabrizicola sp. J26]|uniref:DUF3833 domain-containing protein n=1 Tax=Alitabrizicola rongguiensis TaxID=2909234 RepID=UPI001F2CB7D0|nr:DUF3833 domain-containing protein [Tabrizicola rongguiensis]MCF1710553.1 DUF3833 domain-containing protein [Tabrizicola rongguiensis]
MTPALFTGLFLGLAFVLLLGWVISRRMGFEAQTPRDYAATGPAFDLRAHLDGPLLCEGVIYGPLGRVSSRFVARMEGKWIGAQGRLTERFHYDSGTVQDRVWSLTLGNDGSIQAEAPDVLGVGEGQAQGSAVCLKYRIRLPDDAGGHVLSVTDWMYLLENGTIMNRSQFRKFGIKVAELVATMRKVPA